MEGRNRIRYGQAQIFVSRAKVIDLQRRHLASASPNDEPDGSSARRHAFAICNGLCRVCRFMFRKIDAVTATRAATDNTQLLEAGR